MNIRDRLTAFIESKKISKREFARLVGFSNGYLNKITDNISQAKVENILHTFPELNREWLLYGEGEMLKSPDASNVRAERPFISENLVRVRMVEISPTATFTEFAGTDPRDFDFTYIYPEPGEEIEKEEDIVFEVRGDSMEPRILDHDRVLGKLIRPSQWHWAKGVVIVAYADSFVIKRIADNRLDSESVLVLESDNPLYPCKVSVPLSDIRVMYQAVRIVNAPIK